MGGVRGGTRLEGGWFMVLDSSPSKEDGNPLAPAKARTDPFVHTRSRVSGKP
jgi:hypothetical protein